MFAAKFAFIFALFSFCSAVVATPPACLLAAVNTQPKPGNLDKICGPKSEEVQRTILKLCNSKEDSKAALKAFGSSCKDSGNPVSLIPVNSSPTGSGGSGTATGTGSNPSPTSGGGDGPSDDGPSGSAENPEDADDAAYVHGANTFAVAAVAALVGLAAAV